MRKLLIPGLALLLVLGLSACDLNIFNSFEDIPTYSASELNETTQDIESDDGKVDEDKVTSSSDDATKPPAVAPSAKTYVSQIEEMVENDSLDSLVEDGNTEELVKAADNLDSIVSGVLKGLNIDLETDDADKTFEALVQESFSNASDEEIQDLRETVQSAANAAVAVRLEADPDSRNLVSNSTLLLLDLLASDDSRSLSRTLTYDRDYDIPDKLQIRLVEQDDTEYVIHFNVIADDPLTSETNEEGLEIFFETVDETKEDNGDYATEVNVTSAGAGYVLPVGEILDLDENEEPKNQELVAFLGLIEQLVARDDFGVPYLTAESRLQVIEDFMNNDEQEGEDDRPISDLLAMLDENNIDITKLNKVAATFNSIAPNARAFASTLEYAEGSTTEIDLASVAAKFKEKTGGSLNGKGVDMVTMSILSIAFDYLFDQGSDDSRGLFDTAAFHGFLNDEDLISFEEVTDYSILRIRRVPELLPQLLGYYDAGTALNPDNEDQMEAIRTDILVGAGLAETGTDPLEASAKLERDGARLDKLAALINLNVATLTDDEYAKFADLIASMFTDDSTE